MKSWRHSLLLIPEPLGQVFKTWQVQLPNA
jgi:hypothetical protein